MRQYDQCDINVVMGSGGMFMAPVIRDVGSLGVKAIADATASFEDGIYNDEGNVIDASALGKGTFSIHNLGKYPPLPPSDFKTTPPNGTMTMNITACVLRVATPAYTMLAVCAIRSQYNCPIRCMRGSSLLYPAKAPPNAPHEVGWVNHNQLTHTQFFLSLLPHLPNHHPQACSV